MSIARHHAEWLSLLEISGPFLSMPVLMNAFPQGLDAHDPEAAGELRAAHEEWADNQGGLQPDPAIHTAWLRYVLENTLEMPPDVISEGQAIPSGVKAVVAEHGEVLRPDLMVVDAGSNKPRLLMQVYKADQDLEKPLPTRVWKASPATRMMELLHAADIPLGLIANGEQWTLVYARRGETTAYISWYASLWLEEPLTLRAFRTLLGARRFFGVPDEETLATLLEASAKDQHEVTDQLGYQVRQAVEILLQAIDRIDQDRGRTLLAGISEDRLYEAALTLMMRLVFLLSAEERGLLLLGDPLYDQHYAVSTLRAQLREKADMRGEEILERRYDAWSRLLATFRAVCGGVQHEDLRLTAYGGSLFDPDRFPFLEGRAPGTGWREEPARPLPISSRTVLHLLEAIQMLRVKVPGGGPAEARRLSFRALDIEQIGHVYEGLLDHVAVRAEQPVLGLRGTKHKEPEIPISELEARREKGQEEMIAFLHEQTGRSPGALRKGLELELEPLQGERLRAACGNDPDLIRRVLPFAGLLRQDDMGFSVIIPAGGVYVTEGPTRRATGTHYTPRSLTEPIVQHTLEPQVYVGPAEGEPKEKWQLRTPAELLDLKICDMAMGSGAFLVQACRYLSERLVEAWEIAEPADGSRTAPTPRITPEGKPATGDPGETVIPQDTEERLTLARRLVADRCLYGVDKNPLAVEMAKLSLWLITLAKDRPFSFLDHALRHGDSLIGADEDTFLRWSHSYKGPEMPLFDEVNRKALEEARAKRRELQAFEVRDTRDAKRKAQLLAEAEAAMERIRLGCDLLVGARFLHDLTATERDHLLANALVDYVAGQDFRDENTERAVTAARRQPAFHWSFELSEVFATNEGNGFSAFVGNPPFAGGHRIRGALGKSYLDYLRFAYPGSHGQADLCAFFFLRAFRHLRKGGSLGLIATNTISQGDTRETALDHIVDENGVIHWASHSMSWPGAAAVVVSIVHLYKGKYAGKKFLNNGEVLAISSYLDYIPQISQPFRLQANSGRSFKGSEPGNLGFVIESSEAKLQINRNRENAQVLFPYIHGKDLNSSPSQSGSRWVLYFANMSRTEAERFLDCFAIVRERVYPARSKSRNKQLRNFWWRFRRSTVDLYEAIKDLERVLVIAIVSKTVAFALVPTKQVFSKNLVVFAYDDYAHFAILQSSLHYHWAWLYSSTLKNDLNYSPTDVFHPFPFPDRETQVLADIGEIYHEFRREVMLTRSEGLTETYNRLHDSKDAAADITQLRDLHVQMDHAVAAAYGWDDLDLGHGFRETGQGVRFTISEPARREVLTRLLKLNHERYAEEVRQGLHEKETKGRKRRSQKRKTKDKANSNQLKLL